MARKRCAAVWYDREGDFLAVICEKKEGYVRETANAQVMEKVDKNSHAQSAPYQCVVAAPMRRPSRSVLPSRCVRQ